MPGPSSPDKNVAIPQLPDVPLIQIFRKLEPEDKVTVALVCNRWHHLVYSPAVWKDVTARLDADSLSSADLDSLARRRIHRVVITRVTRPQNVKQLVNALPFLERLDVSCLPMTKPLLAAAFPNPLRSLKNLNLKLKRLDGEIIASIGDAFPNVSHFKVDACCSKDMLLHIGILNHLEELHIRSSGTFLLGPGLPEIPKNPMQIPCLTSLKLLSMGLSDDMLKFLTQFCPNLQSLTAFLYDDVTDAHMQLLTKLKELRLLNLGFVSPTNALSTDMIQNLDKVCYLYLESTCVKDEHLVALSQLRQLQILEISCTDISEEGWRALGRGFGMLRDLTLHKFDCSVCTAVENLAELPSLEAIGFCDLKSTGTQMRSLFLTVNHVHRLTIECGPDETKNHMQDIANFKNLTELQLISTWIGDRELSNLADGRAPLERLTVAECGVRGRGLLNVAKRKKSIRRLEVGRLMNTSILSNIVKELPGLQELTTTSKLSAETRKKLWRLKPGLIVR